ncbi:MAG: CvpA family protein [Bacteroidaceae bacterium]|nr:CvpA family protein [Bacteroidaceae bacterium]
MNTLDIILLVAAGLGALIGLKAGLIKQLSFGVSIAVGLLQASIFYQKAAAWLESITDWDSMVCTIAGFALVFVIVAATINIVGCILRWLLKAILLGWIDRILGALFSAILAIGLVVLGVNISEGIAPENEITGKTSQEESLLYKDCAEVTYLVIEEAKKLDEKAEQYTEEDCE